MVDRTDAAETLGRLVDLVVPADEFPSAGEAGALDFLDRYLRERADLRPRLAGLLAAADPTTHPDWDWFAGLVNGGYYADPANGGNRGRVSWRMVGWAPEPADGWSRAVPVPEVPPVEITPDRLSSRYDAVVIGSGPGGGVSACLLAESGRRVLVVESGSWPSIGELSRDQLRNPRSDWGVLPLSGPGDDRDLRVLEVDGRPRQLRPYEPGWANNAMTAGGGSRVYGAQAWRFEPRDFTMASTYGVPDGSALADWPIGYDDLEPFYSRADHELGVSGSAVGESTRRSRPYPMAPVPTGPRHDLLRAAASRLGWGCVRVPLLINSRPYGGRAVCEGCRRCVGFTCPTDAKAGSANTVLPRAFATGRAEILLQTRAERLVVDGRGRVVGVALVGRSATGATWRSEVGVGEVVVAGGAVESARLLLNSAHDGEPTGLGNRTDQVGRHLQGHVYGGAVGVFDDVVEDLIGPGPTVSTHDFRHGVDGLVGGGILVDEFIPLPGDVYRSLSAAGLIPRWGSGAKRGMRQLLRRSLRVMGPIQEVTSADSRVRVDPSVRDRYGVPVPRLSGSVHAADRQAQAMIAERAVEWLAAAGATRTVSLIGSGDGPSAGQHQAGTCRMGSDPLTSVVDPWCRVWGHDNVRVVDASVHVTNGGVNPVLTVFANAYRVLDQLTR
ncbi:MAG TPA: GMC oxidoreductase [Microlunatus sp.]|nr:GMC oxidoreductase [Microlunatus sp.]